MDGEECKTQEEEEGDARYAVAPPRPRARPLPHASAAAIKNKCGGARRPRPSNLQAKGVEPFTFCAFL